MKRSWPGQMYIWYERGEGYSEFSGGEGTSAMWISFNYSMRRDALLFSYFASGGKDEATNENAAQAV